MEGSSEVSLIFFVLVFACVLTRDRGSARPASPARTAWAGWRRNGIARPAGPAGTTRGTARRNQGCARRARRASSPCSSAPGW
jgi:hypothetical protein